MQQGCWQICAQNCQTTYRCFLSRNFGARKSYWNTSTPVGYVFDIGAVIGFLVGAAIVYQILYSDVYEHLSQYATLKAIGFRDRYLLWIVFQESLILAVLGLCLGWQSRWAFTRLLVRLRYYRW